MKFNILTTSLALGTVFFLFTSSRNPNSPPTGRTGAPGETTCVQSGCHGGGTFTGTVTLSGVPDTVIFSQVYPLTLTNTSNAAIAGFQLTCLDNANAKCGTLTSASGVNVANGSGRQYARQTAPKTLASGSTSWTFNWTAPASASGNAAKFYFVSLCANGNGNSSQDNVLVSNKAVTLSSVTSPAHEPLADSAVKLYPTQVNDRLNILLENETEAQLSIYTADGRLVQQQKLSDRTEVDVTALKAGTYLANIQTAAGSLVKKFVKQ